MSFWRPDIPRYSRWVGDHFHLWRTVIHGLVNRCAKRRRDLNGRPKIAHMFLIRAALNHEAVWEEFFRGQEGLCTVYVHAKWLEQVTSDFIRRHQIPRHCDTEYGHVSLVRAELLLLEEALRDRANQFFLLHSESCVPLWPFALVYQQLHEDGRSWIRYLKGGMHRYRGVDQSAIPRKYFYKALQFFCLNRPHAELLVARGKIEHWEKSVCPDEHFIPTVLSMCGRLSECRRKDVTFACWDPDLCHSPVRPAVFGQLSSGDLKMLRNSGALFARKFAPESDIAAHWSSLNRHRTTLTAPVGAPNA